MKTNVILKSSDRVLFGITVRQNTKDQMLSVTDLQSAYEVARWKHGWAERRIDSVTQTTSFKERAYYVLKERDFIKTSFVGFMEMVDKEGISKVLKKLKVWKTTGRGVNKMVVCNSSIWVLLAMELNPMVYAKVVIWLEDSLIFDRIEAGDKFKPMNSAIATIISKPNFPLFAKEINIKVFGNHQRGMRDLASAQELRKIADVEKFVTNAISMGVAKEQNHILTIINKYEF